MNNQSPVNAEVDGLSITPVKHSGLGIASFVLAILGIILLIISFILTANAAANISASMTEEEFVASAPGIIIASFLVLLTIGFNLIGFILGIIGLFQKQRKKLFSILGVVLNSIGFVVFVIMLIIGAVINGAAI